MSALLRLAIAGLTVWAAVVARGAGAARRLWSDADPSRSPSRPGRPSGGAAVARPRRPRRRAAGREADADALPEAVEAVASAVRAGRSIAEGLASAAAAAPPGLGRQLQAVVHQVHRGATLVTAIDRWAATSAVPGASLVAAAVGLAGDAGGDLDAALAGVANTLRERRAVAREVRALSAQARLSASVIAVAPVAFAVVAVAADRDTAAFLLGSPGGFGCLGAGVGLDVAGWRWMRRITASAA